MDFKSTLEKGCFAVELKSDTKEGVIREMIDMLADAGKLPDRNVAE